MVDGRRRGEGGGLDEGEEEGDVRDLGARRTGRHHDKRYASDSFQSDPALLLILICATDVILAFRWPIAILLFVIVYFLTSNEDPSAVVLRLGTWFMGDAAKGDPPGDLLQDIGRPDL